MPAVIVFDFDPWTEVIGLPIRLETLVLAAVILLVLVLAVLSAGRSRSDDGGADAGHPGLRRDDLILIAFGAVPGAVLGGRLGYGLVHLDYYLADPLAFFDPGRGGLTLTLGVLLGTLTALAVARLLAAPVERWLGVAAVPVMLGLGLGKLAMMLGGAGQGAYLDAPWATAFRHTVTATGSAQTLRPDLWASANPQDAAWPSQLIEGGLVLAMTALLLALPFLLRLRLRRTGRLVRPELVPGREWWFLTGSRRYLTALGLCAAARFVAAFTWRDGRVLGPFVTEQFILVLAAAATAAVAVAVLSPEGVGTFRRAWVAVAPARLTGSLGGHKAAAEGRSPAKPAKRRKPAKPSGKGR